MKQFEKVLGAVSALLLCWGGVFFSCSSSGGGSDDSVIPVTGVRLNRTAYTIAENADPFTLTATIEPSNATNQSVTWIIQNEADDSTEHVTKVDDGTTTKITPIAAGTTTITVKTKSGDFSASCVVTVRAQNEVVDADLTSVSGTYTIDGEKITLDSEQNTTDEDGNTVGVVTDADGNKIGTYALTEDEDGNTVVQITIGEGEDKISYEAATDAAGNLDTGTVVNVDNPETPVVVEKESKDPENPPAEKVTLSEATVKGTYRFVSTKEEEQDDGTTIEVQETQTVVVVDSVIYLHLDLEFEPFAGYLQIGTYEISDKGEVTGTISFEGDQSFTGTAADDGTLASITTVDPKSDAPETVTFERVSDETTHTPAFPLAVTDIKIDTETTKTDYAIGEQLSLTLKVTLDNDIVVPLTVASSEELRNALSGYAKIFARLQNEETPAVVNVPDFDSSTAGRIPFSVSYGDLTDSISLVVEDKQIVSVTLTVSDEAKKAYYVGDAIDVTGLTLTVTYDSGSPSTVPVTESMIAWDASSAGAKSFTVVYADGITTTGTYDVVFTQDTITALSVTHAPSKTAYVVGDTVDTTGLEVTATYESKKTKVLAASEYSVSPTELTEVQSEVVVTVTLTGTAITTTFTVSVAKQPLSKIEATADATAKTTYKQGDTSFVKTGITVKAFYGESDTVGTDVTANATFPATIQAAADGKETVTITYTENGITKETTLELTIASWAYNATIDLTGTTPASAAWTCVPVRDGNTNVAAKVTRAANSYAGYLGRKFWLVDGIYAEYTGGANGLGYTDTANDANRPATQTFAKAIETEAIKGPFKLTVQTQTNAKTRIFKIYQSTSLENLWDAANVVKEVALDSKPKIAYEYSGSDTVYIGMGTQSAKDGEVYKVYTAISAITLESDVAIPEDTFAATGIAFTNADIVDDALAITKDTANYTLTAAVTPSYATDKTYTFAYEKTAGTGAHVAVSSDGKITITDADGMTQNEVGTVTVRANGGENVTATLALTVKGVVTFAEKLEQTKKELESAFNGEASTFAYGNSTTAVVKANAFIATLPLTYYASTVTANKNVGITPSIDATTGNLILTLKDAVGSEAATETVTYAYTDELAKAAVDNAVKAITEANLAWDTDAATTATKANTAITALTLTDATAQAAVVGKTVVVTVTSAFKSDVEDKSIVLEAPKFEVKDGVLYLLADSYEYQFESAKLISTKDDDAWTKTDSGIATQETGGVTKFTTKFTGVNLKKANSAEHPITLKFSGALTADLYVYDGSGNRTFTVNDTTYKTAAKPATGAETNTVYATKVNTKEYIFTIEIAEPSAITTLKLNNPGTSGLSPVGIVLYAPTGEPVSVTGDTSKIPVAANDVTLQKDADSYTYTVSGGAADKAGATFAWYIDDVKQSGSDKTFTLPTSLVKGTTYEVRVSVTVQGVTYSQSEYVLYK